MTKEPVIFEYRKWKLFNLFCILECIRKANKIQAWRLASYTSYEHRYWLSMQLDYEVQEYNLLLLSIRQSEQQLLTDKRGVIHF